MRLRAARGWQASLRKLTLAAIAVSLFLALLEAGSRVVGTFAGPTQPLQVGSIQLYGRHDPLLFWSLRPGAEAPDGTRWVNDKGLRGPEIGRKQSDEYRILSLGESTTFAAQLAYSDSYSAVLESLQNERRLDTRVRVLNAGVPGYSLFQGIVYLKSRAKRLGIDLVLVYFGYNDFLPVAYLAERAGRPELSNTSWTRCTQPPRGTA